MALATKKQAPIPKFHGLKREDATTPVTIPVHRRHVEQAVPHDPDHCIIALAAKSVRAIKWARVGGRIVYIRYADRPNVAVRYVLSNKTYGLTHLFDTATAQVKKNPQLIAGHIITLLPPPATYKLGYKRGKSGTNKRGTGTAKNIHHARPTRKMVWDSNWT